jgi:hypothetical protein
MIYMSTKSCISAYATLENKAKFEEMITERRNKKESGITEDGETVKFNLAVEVVLREVRILHHFCSPFQ